MLQQEAGYLAILSKDSRFDGKFYFGVTTTGIFCRPICPATPKMSNIQLFSSIAEAERFGFRPCMRCQPQKKYEHSFALNENNFLIRALQKLQSIEIFDFNEENYASELGFTKRHLRRVFSNSLGKTPVQILQEYRLLTAKKLIAKSSCNLTDVAYNSGFQSLRRFNASIKEKYQMSPSEIRKNSSENSREFFEFLLPYQKPYDFGALLDFYRSHQVGLLEEFTQNSMSRIFQIHDDIGKINIEHIPEKSSLLLKINCQNISVIPLIIENVKSMFDLQFNPEDLANSIQKVPELKVISDEFPGIRLPTGWDPFEVAIATILGQLVSVERGKNLVADLINLLGNESGFYANEMPIKLFPTPKQILEADLTKLKTTTRRKQTLKDFCRAIILNEIHLNSAQSVSEFSNKLKKIKGIGDWTVNYISLKALKDTNAFPATDLILALALQNYSLEKINEVSPWRGYVAALLWKKFGKSKKSIL
ncbi:Ada metal-binding domain-containing protein [Pigmentibacter sp. JX0631]|uniref:DNA-3-methyladenine glycosylase 2 family protein n=1 Tax=Pigmentibacter sp. JX0631 TaxID=2976982 RepID=UPI0024697B61|nr:Ada metal-binding domain-containing protein [Pigmentibacter sp. JX0631]WGL59722.1 Ada metal-binding domain-containing protein [Pigmentibacter sp. JX0631]